MDDHALMQRITKEIMYELIDEVTLSLCFEVHRSAKLGTIFLSETDPESDRNHQIVDTVGKDVFGQVRSLVSSHVSPSYLGSFRLTFMHDHSIASCRHP